MPIEVEKTARYIFNSKDKNNNPLGYWGDLVFEQDTVKLSIVKSGVEKIELFEEQSIDGFFEMIREMEKSYNAKIYGDTVQDSR